MDKRYIDRLEKLHACDKAVEWAKTQATPAEAWAACENGSWMLWLCGKYAGEPWSKGRKPLVLAACECARLSLVHVPAGEKRSLVAIETAEKWAKGKATRRELETAADAADAADAAYAAAAYTAAYTAADAAAYGAAAYAATAAYGAAAYAATAAYGAAAYAADAAYAATAAYAAAARKEVLKQCATIVRKYYPKPPGGK